MEPPDHYDIVYDISLRVWAGDRYEAIQTGFVRIGQIDHLAGNELTATEAVAMGRSMLEAKSARVIAETAAAVLRLRSEPPVLPFG